MRIIGGKYGGQRIQPPAHMPHTRPTTDIAKEGLFNIIENSFNLEGIRTLDLFGGTGCISYELASRGADDLTIVEKDARQAQFIRKTADRLGIPNLQLLKTDVFRFLQQCDGQYDFIFAGPPYALREIDQLPVLVFEKNILRAGGWFVLEHTPRNDYSRHPRFYRQRNYGTTIFSIFTHGTETA
ncbi:RsmD family RNA methyltransferase [Compostibacter hankyongensis]|uniref:RsmD family RNA methyltransferase n=1 Tax=Compostibacter hankyongensis TaxID=1007089 RepID=A0ABP8G7E7_9BACT